MQFQNKDRETNDVPGEVKWNAVHIRYQHERKVEELLSAKGFETFLPTYEITRRWKDRSKRTEEALFPGYLFVANASEHRLRILATPGVCTLVSVAGVPATISNQEIEAVRKSVADPSRVEPHPFLNAGDFVEVQWGPLAGVEGILVRRKDSCRLVVSVAILGRAAAVEIDATSVVKAARRRKIAAVGLSSSASFGNFLS